MNRVVSIDPNDISTTEVQKILQAAVAPRPIALASTVDIDGNINLSPFSFFNVFSANPPIMIFSPARRVRDGSSKHTLENALETKEVVINIVNFAMVEQMSLSSTEYEKDVNEFIKSGFNSVSSIKVRPPRVAQSPVSFECIVNDIIPLGDKGGAGNLIISKVVHIHIDKDYLNPDGTIKTQELDLVGRMGENWYTRASGSSLFEIPKPVNGIGIGVDQLPKHIFKTNILSGNNIGRLGNVNKIPTKEEINAYKTNIDVNKILHIPEDQERLKAIHSMTKMHLETDNIELALRTIFLIR